MPLASAWPGVFKALSDSLQHQSPWWQSFDAEVLAAIHGLSFDRLLSWLNDRAQGTGIVSGRGAPLSFVPQSQLPSGIAYESWIAKTGEVPTRDNLHDRYNALMWLTFPKTKAKLNAVQASELDRLGMTGKRGPVRDAATLWDENLVVVLAQESANELQAALDLHDWQTLFLKNRSHWHTRWHLVPFGHALLEKLASPYKAITGHAIVQEMSSRDRHQLDVVLSDRVHLGMNTAIFRPLPVMGVPGWDAANQAEDFYADPKVFRLSRAS